MTLDTTRSEDAVFMALAAYEAEKFIGATAPNPPVGACLVRDGKILAVGAHARAGFDHAEVVTIKRALELHGEAAVRGATLYVTLEPCNHHGKTPPCTEAILKAGVTRVVFGIEDPNPAVAGGGALELQHHQVKVIEGTGKQICLNLIEPFLKLKTTGLPWIVHKLAYRVLKDGTLSMLPEPGMKTFTSQESLKEAHLERKKCDAILTGIGTVLVDQPLFNVRHLEDHPKKKRPLIVLSRKRTELPSSWVEQQKGLGFEVELASDPIEALEQLGQKGALRVLVEAGPQLSQWVISEGAWDERLVFFSGIAGEDQDFFIRERACSPES
ncbi:MAG: bifunctional diaminohydroxyphosphoribosylaminopyrimidine deaminase/5-amino-6-(5-phosphoribosylamino)uracil reductase RibD [Bdellovibrionota bacterium]